MALPKYVNMVIVIPYDPEAIKGDLVLMNPDMEVTDDHIMDMIRDWAEDDSLGLDYILVDENGMEV